MLRLSDRANDRGGRHLDGTRRRNDTRRGAGPDDGLLLLRVHDDALLVDVLQVGLEVRLLLELLGANVARVLVVAMAVDSDHVPTQAALALELLEADVAVVPRSLVLSLLVHVAAAGRPELLSAPLARVELGHVVNGVDVPGDIGGPGEGLVANVALVLGVLMLGLGMNGQARLRLVALAAVPALVGCFLGDDAAGDFAALLVDLLNVPLQAGLLREPSLAKRADEERVLVLLGHVAVKGRLGREDLVAKLARKTLADLVVESLDVGQEVVLLKKKLKREKIKLFKSLDQGLTGCLGSTGASSATSMAIIDFIRRDTSTKTTNSCVSLNLPNFKIKHTWLNEKLQQTKKSNRINS